MEITIFVVVGVAVALTILGIVVAAVIAVLVGRKAASDGKTSNATLFIVLAVVGVLLLVPCAIVGVGLVAGGLLIQRKSAPSIPPPGPMMAEPMRTAPHSAPKSVPPAEARPKE
jgi:hypothetical protein